MQAVYFEYVAKRGGVVMAVFSVTDQARPKLEHFLDEAGKPESYLRISIDGVR